jgi:hypothetical protein
VRGQGRSAGGGSRVPGSVCLGGGATKGEPCRLHSPQQGATREEKPPRHATVEQVRHARPPPSASEQASASAKNLGKRYHL